MLAQSVEKDISMRIILFLLICSLFIPGESFAERTFEEDLYLCDHGLAMGCFRVGYYYSRILKIPDYTRSSYYYQKACDLGDKNSCHHARTNKHKSLIPFDNGSRSEVEKFLDNSCTDWALNGYYEACSNAARAYEFEKFGVEKDMGKAYEFFAKACIVSGEDLSCNYAKEIHANLDSYNLRLVNKKLSDFKKRLDHSKKSTIVNDNEERSEYVNLRDIDNWKKTRKKRNNILDYKEEAGYFIRENIGSPILCIKKTREYSVILKNFSDYLESVIAETSNQLLRDYYKVLHVTFSEASEINYVGAYLLEAKQKNNYDIIYSLSNAVVSREAAYLARPVFSRIVLEQRIQEYRTLDRKAFKENTIKEIKAINRIQNSSIWYRLNM